MHNLRQAMRQNGLFVAVAVLLCLMAMASPMHHHLAESRFWRDLTGQTPFTHVVVEQVTATAQELVLSGTHLCSGEVQTNLVFEIPWPAPPK